MRSFKVITDPGAFQLLADETRRRIIYLLRAKAMTVAQIAEDLDLTPQAIYHHIRKLKDADMVEVAKEERVGHLIETYYQATAEMFNLAHGQTGSGGAMEEEVREALSGLPNLGLKVNVDSDMVSEVVRLTKCIMEPDAKSPWTEKVNELASVSYLGKQQLLEFLYLMTTSDKEFETFLKNYRELRKTLRSGLQEPIAVAAKS